MKTSFATVIVLALVFMYVSCATYRERELKNEGGQLISKVESFRKDKGRLPETLAELGLKEREEGPLYYKRESESRYVIWFGTQLGESPTYDSERRAWTP